MTDTVFQVDIQWCGRRRILACDGCCNKAWGVSTRPCIEFDPEDPDDIAFLADHELGDAPACNGTWEGGHGKPSSPDRMNKWCSRQCERSIIIETGAPIELPSFEHRRYNQPWKHLNAEKGPR